MKKLTTLKTGLVNMHRTSWDEYQHEMETTFIKLEVGHSLTLTITLTLHHFYELLINIKVNLR